MSANIDQRGVPGAAPQTALRILSRDGSAAGSAIQARPCPEKRSSTQTQLLVWSPAMMKHQSTQRKRALIIVDVQSAFITKQNAYVVTRIQHHIRHEPYDLYIESIFHAEKGSLWDRQTDWICPQDASFQSVPEILNSLEGRKVIHVEKETKSVFKGAPSILPELKANFIEEIHIVGYDTNDCVLATAYESFDLGFFTYVIEECTGSSGDLNLHRQALKLLRWVSLTKSFVKQKANR